MDSGEINPLIFRNITYALKIPNIEDIRVATYANLIQSIIPNLPSDFDILSVETELKKYYGFTEVSKLLIGNALLSLIDVKIDKKTFDGTYKQTMFKVDKKKMMNPYNKILEKLLKKISNETGELDSHQTILIQNLLNITICELAEVSDQIVASFMENYDFELPHSLLSIIEEKWKKDLETLDKTYFEKFNKFFLNSLTSLKSLFADKEEISEILGMISLTLVYRSFILADPDLEKITKDIFSKTKIIVDTNIIIAYLCQGCLEHFETRFLLESCDNVGIKFVLLDKTIDEFNRTLLKDNVKHSLHHAAGKTDLIFASRDIPMGYYRKFSKIGSWNSYMKYLENGINNFKNSFNVELLSNINFKRDIFFSAKQCILQSLKDKYKDDNAINHDVHLVLTGHKIQEEIKNPSFPSFVLTREPKLISAEHKMIFTEEILHTPQMVKTPELLIELLLPFFAKPENTRQVHKIMGKIFSNIVTDIDKKLFEYFVEYLSIEKNLSIHGANKLTQIVLDDYVSEKLFIQKEESSREEFPTKYMDTLNTELKKLDESSKLHERLLKIIELAKTPPISSTFVPKIQSSVISSLLQLFSEKLPIFCSPKPKDELEFQNEINKLLRSNEAVQ